MNKLFKISFLIIIIAVVLQLVDLSFVNIYFNERKRDDISLSSVLNNGRYQAVVVSRGANYSDDLYILDTRTGNCLSHRG